MKGKEEKMEVLERSNELLCAHRLFPTLDVCARLRRKEDQMSPLLKIEHREDNMIKAPLIFEIHSEKLDKRKSDLLVNESRHSYRHSVACRAHYSTINMDRPGASPKNERSTINSESVETALKK